MVESILAGVIVGIPGGIRAPVPAQRLRGWGKRGNFGGPHPDLSSSSSQGVEFVGSQERDPGVCSQIGDLDVTLECALPGELWWEGSA